jgi:solute carrier family 35 protein E1
MKLNSITLTLALASTAACLGAAYSLSPVRSTGTISGRRGHASAAFVHGPRGDAKSTASSTALSAASASSSALAAGGDGDAVMTRRGGAAIGGIDVPLLMYFGLWYLGNYYYNITNKLALKAAGGASGFPLTISALQLGIGSLYGIFLWLAPDARNKPNVTLDDVSTIVRS